MRSLETLTAVWRGDETETEGLRLLARLYRDDGRYRDAFHAMRVAVLAHPDSEMTRQIQDESGGGLPGFVPGRQRRQARADRGLGVVL
jgi:hypothetical protein